MPGGPSRGAGPTRTGSFRPGSPWGRGGAVRLRTGRRPTGSAATPRGVPTPPPHRMPPRAPRRHLPRGPPLVPWPVLTRNPTCRRFRCAGSPGPRLGPPGPSPPPAPNPRPGPHPWPNAHPRRLVRRRRCPSPRRLPLPRRLRRHLLPRPQLPRHPHRPLRPHRPRHLSPRAQSVQAQTPPLRPGRPSRKGPAHCGRVDRCGSPSWRQRVPRFWVGRRSSGSS